jgi:hypothetical protein
VSGDYVAELAAFCTEWLKQNAGCDLIDHGFGPEHGGELTTTKLRAALDELVQLRAERALAPLRDVDARVADNAIGLLKSQRRPGKPPEIYNAICLLVAQFGGRIEAVDTALEACGVEVGD